MAICYIEMDGDISNNLEAFEDVIRMMHDAGVGYGAINHPVDRDPVCGFTGIIGDTCPKCGRHDGEEINLGELRKKVGSKIDLPSYGDILNTNNVTIATNED